ncbi:unnamed protein product [marine sediment metagenome]|uniref:ABC transporter domain-containing protein n=1 Tax=marine sediment metagenome TaxID=412755 RepID=X0YWZ4_9ZZZZ
MINESLCNNIPEKAEYFNKNATDLIKTIHTNSKQIIEEANNLQVSKIKVICNKFQKDFVDWLGFNVIATYPPPEMISIKQFLKLLLKGKTENVVLIIDNLQKGINLKIKKGEFLCIIGPNGAGKTTLLETINGLLECTKGQTRVFGKTIKKFGCSIRKEIGYVPQEFGVDNFTPFIVKDVIMMGRFGKIGLLKSISNKDYLKVGKAIEAMEINELANRPIGKLSGGQLQR